MFVLYVEGLLNAAVFTYACYVMESFNRDKYLSRIRWEKLLLGAGPNFFLFSRRVCVEERALTQETRVLEGRGG